MHMAGVCFAGDVLLLDLKAFFSHFYVLLLELPQNTHHIPVVLTCLAHMSKQAQMVRTDILDSVWVFWTSTLAQDVSHFVLFYLFEMPKLDLSISDWC
jgi:hypothetical protein